MESVKILISMSCSVCGATILSKHISNSGMMAFYEIEPCINGCKLPQDNIESKPEQVEGANLQTHNSKSMPLCDGCNKPFPELICYCEDCLNHVISMGA